MPTIDASIERHHASSVSSNVPRKHTGPRVNVFAQIRSTRLRVLLLVPAMLAWGCSAAEKLVTEPDTTVNSVQVTNAPTDGVLMEGATVTLSASPRNAAGQVLEEQMVSWTSSNNAVATVSQDGVVTGVAAGPVTISATAGGVAGTAALSVRTGIVVPPASAGEPTTTTALEGAVTLTIPPAATSSTTLLTVAPTSTPLTNVRVPGGTTFDFGPAGTVFDTPITLTLAYDAAAVPVAEQENLRIFLVEGTRLLEVEGGSVDLVNHLVTAPVEHFSTYTIALRAEPTQVAMAVGSAEPVAPAGSAVASVPSVVVRDLEGTPVAGVDVVFSVTAGGGSLSGETTAVSDVSGIASFAGTWTLGTSAGTNTLTATIAGTAITGTINATATPVAAQVGIATQPSGAVSGLAFSQQPVIELRDIDGVLAYTATASVTATLAAGSGTLLGTTTVNAVGGVATFSNLRIDGAGEHTITFSSTGLTSATSTSFVVSQVVASLVVTTQPAGAVSGTAFSTQPVVELRDNAGLPVVGGTANVTASVASGTGALYGGLTVESFDGVATFTDLAIEGTGAHTLSFTSGTATAATSASFSVASAGLGMRVLVGAAPVATVAAGQDLALPLTVDLTDRGTDDLASITLTLTWDPARFTYAGETAGNWVDSQGGASTVLLNTDNTAAGSLQVTGFTSQETLASFTLRTITLTANATAGSVDTPVTVTITAAGNALGTDVTVTPRNLTATVTP